MPDTVEYTVIKDTIKDPVKDTVTDKQAQQEDTKNAVHVPRVVPGTEEYFLETVYLCFVALMFLFMVYIVYMEFSSKTTQVNCPDYM